MANIPSTIIDSVNCSLKMAYLVMKQIFMKLKENTPILKVGTMFFYERRNWKCGYVEEAADDGNVVLTQFTHKVFPEKTEKHYSELFHSFFKVFQWLLKNSRHPSGCEFFEISFLNKFLNAILNILINIYSLVFSRIL